MSFPLRVVFAAACWGWLGATTARTADFHGWQGLRVMAQEGKPDRMSAADLDADGRDELILVNTRQSRLDLYRWLPPEQRRPAPVADADRPNELPLAPDWTHYEVPLDDLPADALAADVDGDARPELLVLTGPELKLTIFQSESVGKWKRLRFHDLMSGQLTGRGPLLLLRTVDARHRELLISCEQGIQVLPLSADARPAWFHPRETTPRVDWRLVDLDADGDRDLLEWTTKANQTVRWYECSGGALRPAQALHDQTVQQVGSLAGGDGPAEVLGLGGSQLGAVRRYQLARGDESPWGRRATLPLALAPAAPWCGLKLGDAPALIAASADEPKLRAYRLVDGEWSGEESFPTIGNVRELAAPAAREGTLLVWVKDAADLYESRWEAQRLTYPKPIVHSADVADRRIVALEAVGATVWWAQRVGDDLDLFVWKPADKQPQRTRFDKAGTKVERVRWLGGTRLLVQQQYSTAAKLVVQADGKTRSSDLPQLAKANLAEYAPYDDGDTWRVGRLTGGVLQWLDEQLQPVDQAMLPDGRKLSALLPAGGDAAVALEEGGNFLHRVRLAGGKVDIERTLRIHGTLGLREDRLLGLFLVDAERIVRLSAGRPWELKLVDTIDGRQGRPSGVKEAVIHRFLTTDLDGDGVDDALLCDDRRHTLAALERKRGELRPLVAWQVFEDQLYPYGGGAEGSEAPISEPRAVVAFNADGDPQRDLALLSQDRLLVYLGREVQP